MPYACWRKNATQQQQQQQRMISVQPHSVDQPRRPVELGDCATIDCVHATGLLAAVTVAAAAAGEYQQQQQQQEFSYKTFISHSAQPGSTIYVLWQYRIAAQHRQAVHNLQPETIADNWSLAVQSDNTT
jgi:hypothetical protein